MWRSLFTLRSLWLWRGLLLLRRRRRLLLLLLRRPLLGSGRRFSLRCVLFMVHGHFHKMFFGMRRRLWFRRLSALRRSSAGVCRLWVRFLLCEWLWPLSKSFVEGRAKSSREVRWMVVTDGAVVSEILFSVDVWLRGRRHVRGFSFTEVRAVVD